MAAVEFCAPPLLLLLCLAVATSHGGDAAHHRHAAAPAPTAAADCSSALFSLADCLPFVEEGSSEPKPQKECCSALRKVVAEAAEAACLCDALSQGASSGLSLNVTKALALPSSCGIAVPSLGHCKVLLPAAAAPAPSPSGASSRAATAPSPFSSYPTSEAPPLSTASVESFIGIAIAICSYVYYSCSVVDIINYRKG